jgi:hypothetical protein
MRSGLIPLGLWAALTSPALAAGRSFSIGTVPVSETDILDARAQPAIGGAPTVLITLDDRIAAKIHKLQDKNVKVTLDGKLIAIVHQPSDDDQTIAVPGGASITEAEALARLISGKEPLPDTLEENP